MTPKAAIKPYAKPTANYRNRLRESNTVKRLEQLDARPQRKLQITTEAKSSTIFAKTTTPKSQVHINTFSSTKNVASTQNLRGEMSQTRSTKPKSSIKEKSTPRNEPIQTISTKRQADLSSHRKQKSNVTINHLKEKVKKDQPPLQAEPGKQTIEQEPLYSFDCRTHQIDSHLINNTDKSRDESSLFDCEQYGTFSSHNQRLKFILEKAQLINENITSCYTLAPDSNSNMDAIARIKLRY